jgi:hypothetical protein
MNLKADAWLWSVAFAVLYLLLAIILPPNTAIIQTYNLSNTEYHVLMLLVGIPMVAVWFAAFYGYVKLAEYARLIRNHREGAAFRYLARGVKWLAWGLPACATLNSLLGGLAHSSHDLLGAAVIISHYAFLAVALLAFSDMATGARQLADIHGVLPPKPILRSILLGLIVLSVGYTYITVHAVTKHNNPYHLPMWLILFTIIIPYLYAWVMGLVAAFQIGVYRRSVSGLLYQRALSMLAGGTMLAIVAAIVFQYVTGSSGYLRRVHLNGSLLWLYLVLAAYAIGFLLMARGAERLRRIEEV